MSVITIVLKQLNFDPTETIFPQWIQIIHVTFSHFFLLLKDIPVIECMNDLIMFLLIIMFMLYTLNYVLRVYLEHGFNV